MPDDMEKALDLSRAEIKRNMKKFLKANPEDFLSPIIALALYDGFGFLVVSPGVDDTYSNEQADKVKIVVIDDGSLTHKMAGTKMGPGAFCQEPLKKLITSAKVIIINAGPSDHDAGTLLATGAVMRGRSIMIDTEMPAWADWARFCFAHKSDDCIPAIRIPADTVVPDDLVDKVNFEWERQFATSH